MRARIFYLLFYCSISFGVVREYQSQIRSFDAENGRFVLHQQIIDGTADSPYRYRVLVPKILNLFIDRDVAGVVDGRSFDRVYFFFFLVFVSLSLFLIAIAAETFTNRHAARISPLFLAVAFPYGLRDHGFQPWSILEVFLISLAVLLVVRRDSYWSLAALCFVATLNRETAFVIPGIVFAKVLFEFLQTKRVQWSRVFCFVVLSLVWFFTYAGLRFDLGKAKPVDMSLINDLNYGPGRLGIALENIAVLALPILTLVLKNTLTNLFVRKMLISLLPVLTLYLISVFQFGVWSEVRLLLPLFPILIPLAVFDSREFRDH